MGVNDTLSTNKQINKQREREKRVDKVTKESKIKHKEITDRQSGGRKEDERVK